MFPCIGQLKGEDDIKGCSDGIESDKYYRGISLFRGQSVVPIRREHRKTNHKKRHSSKRKLEEIDRLRIDVMKNGNGREGCHG